MRKGKTLQSKEEGFQTGQTLNSSQIKRGRALERNPQKSNDMNWGGIKTNGAIKGTQANTKKGGKKKKGN